MRNHDELTLDKLSEDERAEVFARFGADPSLQLYGRGLRRRLPTMLDGDERAIRMVYSLAFSLPGTPVLFYGEEIGMAENLAIEGRYSVRAPMQWSPDGGFTRLRRAVPADGRGRLRARSGSTSPTQRRDPDSLLNWFERLIRRRRECPELGFGDADAAGHRRAVGPRPPLRLGGRDDRRRPRALRHARSRSRCRSTTARRSSTSSGTPSPRSRRRSTSSPTPPTGSASAARAGGFRP